MSTPSVVYSTSSCRPRWDRELTIVSAGCRYVGIGLFARSCGLLRNHLATLDDFIAFDLGGTRLSSRGGASQRRPPRQSLTVTTYRLSLPSRLFVTFGGIYFDDVTGLVECCVLKILRRRQDIETFRLNLTDRVSGRDRHASRFQVALNVDDPESNYGVVVVFTSTVDLVLRWTTLI
ncbi:hypothetical protein BDZ89DRAFT_1169201 [Hymenopellis radicata]|nr:hypothetical protein BDZ89DRAFT_1169201 [Hymenopellis radicata]